MMETSVIVIPDSVRFVDGGMDVIEWVRINHVLGVAESGLGDAVHQGCTAHPVATASMVVSELSISNP